MGVLITGYTVVPSVVHSASIYYDRHLQDEEPIFIRKWLKVKQFYNSNCYEQKIAGDWVVFGS